MGRHRKSNHSKHRGWHVTEHGQAVGYKSRRQAVAVARQVQDARVEGPLSGALRALLGGRRHS